MELQFPTDFSAILKKSDQIDPLEYGKSRNYVDGAVTYLSPYISRGVISTNQVLQRTMDNGYKLPEMDSFVKELCWRDYFQRVGQERDLNQDIKHAQQLVSNYAIPLAIVQGNSGIEGIDHAINQLYATGYMHNHCRMYTAALVCNVAQSHWLNPARWMYYHLLDGDWASNACSWQWVAGANSSKKYYANQENVNRFTSTQQSNTFLDLPYDDFEQMDVPPGLQQTQKFEAATVLPDTIDIQMDSRIPTFLYNYYNLDPEWHQNEEGNRVLLLDPEFFASFPISPKCMDFALRLSGNIKDIQVFVGSFHQLKKQWDLKDIHFKEHPLNFGYEGIQEPRDWIAPEIAGYFPSFFAYWKKVSKVLTSKYAAYDH